MKQSNSNQNKSTSPPGCLVGQLVGWAGPIMMHMRLRPPSFRPNNQGWGSVTIVPLFVRLGLTSALVRECYGY